MPDCCCKSLLRHIFARAPFEPRPARPLQVSDLHSIISELPKTDGSNVCIYNHVIKNVRNEVLESSKYVRSEILDSSDGGGYLFSLLEFCRQIRASV